MKSCTIQKLALVLVTAGIVLLLLKTTKEKYESVEEGFTDTAGNLFKGFMVLLWIVFIIVLVTSLGGSSFFMFSALFEMWN